MFLSTYLRALHILLNITILQRLTFYNYLIFTHFSHSFVYQTNAKTPVFQFHRTALFINILTFTNIFQVFFILFFVHHIFFDKCRMSYFFLPKVFDAHPRAPYCIHFTNLNSEQIKNQPITTKTN